MFDNFFGSKKFTHEDLLNELLGSEFNEIKVNKVYKALSSVKWNNKEGETLLHLCAKENKPSSIQWLLKRGMDVDIKTKSGLTPLFYAVQNGALECVDLLISKSADVYLLDTNNRTLLQEAVSNNQYDVAKLLLKYPIDINNVDKEGKTTLFDAISSMNNHMIELVINVNKLDLNHQDSNGNTVLFYDSVNVDSGMVLKLIDRGIDLTLQNSEGLNYIFYALTGRILSIEVLQHALTMGYDINYKCQGKTLLMSLFEMKNPDVDMLEFLLSKNLRLDEVDDNGENILFTLVRKNDLNYVKKLLEKKAFNVNHKNLEGNTVLVEAVLRGKSYEAMFLELLKFGANPNIADVNGATLVEKMIDVILHTRNTKKINRSLQEIINPDDDYFELFKTLLMNSKLFLRKLNSHGKPLFFDAIFYSNAPLFKLLQNYGADINHKDKDGRNILHNLLVMSDSPIFKNQKDFQKLLHDLIFHGADVNSKDESGSSTAHNAILHTNEHTLKVLLDSKADPKAIDNQGRSLMHNCVWDAKMKHFKLLHNYNENILNMPDKYGILPINYAAFIGHTDLVLEMITARAHVNNPYKKSEKMVSFFRKYAPNVYRLNDKVKDDFERKNIKMLIANMKKEFNLEEIKVS